MFDWRGYAKMKLYTGLALLITYGLIYLFTLPQRIEMEALMEQDIGPHTTRVYDPNEMKEYITGYYPRQGWEHAYILTDVPEDFELRSFHTEILDGPFLFPEKSYVIRFGFSKWDDAISDYGHRFYFEQSKSAEFDETMGLLEQIERPKENTYYYGTNDNKNVVFWLDDDYTLYVRDDLGSMTFAELKEIAEYAEPYVCETTPTLTPQ